MPSWNQSPHSFNQGTYDRVASSIQSGGSAIARTNTFIRTVWAWMAGGLTLTAALAWLVASGEYDVALGSRILGGTALGGGMPLYKYVSNRALTFFQNLATGAKLSEYHTGFRAFSRETLETVRWQDNSDDFVFDNQILNQVLAEGFRIGEISCPTKYFDEASSISFSRSVRYGLGVVMEAIRFRLRARKVSRR